MELLEIKNLRVTFDNISEHITAVNNISFDLKNGEILSIIGESGSGKSVTAKAIINLLDKKDGSNVSGEIKFNGADMCKLKPKEICQIRGNQITMIFQEPMTALNPVMTIYDQIDEIFNIHKIGNKKENKNKIIEIFNKLNIPNPNEMLKKYPFELSGGLRQRIIIAMAIVCQPKVIIADEPTTALDVTTQAEILLLLKNVAKELDSSVILITHDLGVVAEIASRVIVMYKGSIVESCNTANFFDNPMHPYSIELMKSRPSNFNGRYYTIKGNIEKNNTEENLCPYIERCCFCMDMCREKMPIKREVEDCHFVSCWKLLQ